MRAGYIGGLVNRKGYIQIRNFLVRVVLKGGLYLRAGSVTGFTVCTLTLVFLNISVKVTGLGYVYRLITIVFTKFF